MNALPRKKTPCSTLSLSSTLRSSVVLAVEFSQDVVTELLRGLSLRRPCAFLEVEDIVPHEVVE